MKSFNDLITVIDKLLSPEGCPWDREQTLSSMRSSCIEEACEVVEAIDLDDCEQIEEELGDLLFNVIFLCRLAEKENKSSLKAVLNHITKKLIRRHPHVFEKEQIATTDQVLDQWEKIKRNEKGKETRITPLDGIPKALPSLARAQKVIGKMKKSGYCIQSETSMEAEKNLEPAFGNLLFQIVVDASLNGVDAEQALRKFLSLEEQKFLKKLEE